MKKSLYNEIITEMERCLESSKTDGHYKEGSFTTARGAVHHALASCIGNVKAITGSRDIAARKAANKRKK